MISKCIFKKTYYDIVSMEKDTKDRPLYFYKCPDCGEYHLTKHKNNNPINNYIEDDKPWHILLKELQDIDLVLSSTDKGAPLINQKNIITKKYKEAKEKNKKYRPVEYIFFEVAMEQLSTEDFFKILKMANDRRDNETI
jgi:hypothetical protein